MRAGHGCTQTMNVLRPPGPSGGYTSTSSMSSRKFSEVDILWARSLIFATPPPNYNPDDSCQSNLSVGLGSELVRKQM